MIKNIIFGTEDNKAYYVQASCDQEHLGQPCECKSYGEGLTEIEAKKLAHDLGKSLNVPVKCVIQKINFEKLYEYSIAQLNEVAYLFGCLSDKIKLPNEFNTIETRNSLYNKVFNEWSTMSATFATEEEEGYIGAYTQRRITELFSKDTSNNQKLDDFLKEHAEGIVSEPVIAQLNNIAYLIGTISKTINLSKYSSIEEMNELYIDVLKELLGKDILIKSFGTAVLEDILYYIEPDIKITN